MKTTYYFHSVHGKGIMTEYRNGKVQFVFFIVTPDGNNEQKVLNFFSVEECKTQIENDGWEFEIL